MMALVTGVPGWLGTKLVRALLKNGAYEVRCLVHPASPPGLCNTLNAEVVRGDLVNPASLRDVCKGVDVVFHCAGMIHPRKKALFYTVNTEGTRNLALEAVKDGVKRFVYVSSSSAGIGYSSNRMVTEEDPPEPFMDYGLSKLKAENWLLDICARRKMEAVILRPHWLYGEDGPERQLAFFRMIRRGRPLLFGNGQNSRSLCHIGNCVEALLLAASVKNAHARVFYIADSQPYHIGDVYRTIAETLGCAIKLRRVHLPSFDSFRYRMMDRWMQRARYYFPGIHLAWDWCKNIASSIRKAREELGYEPRYQFADGIRMAVKQYREHGVLPA